jgi:hypothetical protein
MAETRVGGLGYETSPPLAYDAGLLLSVAGFPRPFGRIDHLLLGCDVRQDPCLIEERLFWAIEAEENLKIVYNSVAAQCPTCHATTSFDPHDASVNLQL